MHTLHALALSPQHTRALNAYSWDSALNDALPAGTQILSASPAGPTNGVYPVGCKWRDIQPEGQQRGFWDIVAYQYWSDVAQRWVAKMPEACFVRGKDSTRRLAQTVICHLH